MNFITEGFALTDISHFRSLKDFKSADSCVFPESQCSSIPNFLMNTISNCAKLVCNWLISLRINSRISPFWVFIRSDKQIGKDWIYRYYFLASRISNKQDQDFLCEVCTKGRTVY